MRLCVITGTSSGLGLCLAQAFTAAGYDVVGIDRDPPPTDWPAPAPTSGTIRFLTADLADHDQLASLIVGLAEGPPIEILIHNAGTNWVGRFEDCELGDQDRVVEVNFTAPMVMTSGLLGRQAIAATASIVFIASLSCQTSYPGAAVYAATKDGLASYASSLAAGSALHVLTVYPGPLRTAMARRWSPNEANENSRMRPERLAGRIVRCVRRRRRALIPGLGNGLLALLGSGWPSLAERGMKKVIFDRL